MEDRVGSTSAQRTVESGIGSISSSEEEARRVYFACGTRCSRSVYPSVGGNKVKCLAPRTTAYMFSYGSRQIKRVINGKGIVRYRYERWLRSCYLLSKYSPHREFALVPFGLCEPCGRRSGTILTHRVLHSPTISLLAHRTRVPDTIPSPRGDRDRAQSQSRYTCCRSATGGNTPRWIHPLICSDVSPTKNETQNTYLL
jgi:hypothetical protein